MSDKAFMRRAIELAAAGVGRVSPNPAVGAVLVRDGRIIGEGYHREYGGPHAETDCIHNAHARGESTEGAVMYCTLEPCAFRSPTKHNPPCTESILHAGISRLFIAARDPNPEVSGCGAQMLEEAGVETLCGLMEQEVLALNEAYFLATAMRRPLVHLKWAQTLNGRLARAGGGKTPISGPDAVAHSHGLRAVVDAVLVGLGTVTADDPALTVREVGALKRTWPVRQPLRVVLDSQLRLPLNAQLCTDGAAHTLVLCSTAAELQGRGVEVLQLPADSTADGDIAPATVLEALYERGIRSVLVEGGAKTHERFLSAGLWDRLTVYTGPVLVGGTVHAPEAAGVERLCSQEACVLGDTVSLSGLNPAAQRVLDGLRWESCGLPLPQEVHHVHRLST